MQDHCTGAAQAQRNSRSRLVRLVLSPSPPTTTTRAPATVTLKQARIRRGRGRNTQPAGPRQSRHMQQKNANGPGGARASGVLALPNESRGASLQKALAAWRITPRPITLRCLPIPAAARRHTEWHPARQAGDWFLGLGEQALQMCKGRGVKTPQVALKHRDTPGGQAYPDRPLISAFWALWAVESLSSVASRASLFAEPGKSYGQALVARQA